MTQLVVLALDIAKNRSGWAVGSVGFPRPYWGVHQIVGQWDGNEGKCLREWREFVADKIERFGVTYISVESLIIPPREFNFDSHIPMAQKHGIVLDLAEERGIEMGAAHIASWRSHFLGTAKAPPGLESAQRTKALKELAMRRCMDRGWYPAFHDEAEALGILDYSLACKDRDYDHKVGPMVRRAEQRAEIAHFRGEAPK